MDYIAGKCEDWDIKRVLLLGTKAIMTNESIKRRLAEHGIEVMDTSDYLEEIEEIDRIISEELYQGVVNPESKEFMMNFVYQFPADSNIRPNAVIFGCTELSMILEPGDLDIPFIDCY